MSQPLCPYQNSEAGFHLAVMDLDQAEASLPAGLSDLQREAVIDWYVARMPLHRDWADALRYTRAPSKSPAWAEPEDFPDHETIGDM